LQKIILFALFVFTIISYEKIKVKKMDKKEFYSKILDKYIVDKVYYNETKLPIEIIFGVIYKESRFKQMAKHKNRNRNGKGIDIGLFQLNSKVYKQYTEPELFNIDTNIKLGIEHLNKCYEYTDDIKSALRLYHLGHGNVYHNRLKDEQYIYDVINFANYLQSQYNSYLSLKECKK
jgi:soluble lytic murein transglycosylase-like protein